MADLIKIKAGSGNVPALQERELAYHKDEKALYIGTGDKNERLCGAGDIAEVNSRLDSINAETNEIKATITTLNGLIDEINARLDALTPTE